MANTLGFTSKDLPSPRSTLPQSRSSALKNLFVPKAEQEARLMLLLLLQEGWMGETPAFRTHHRQGSFCGPGNTPDPRCGPRRSRTEALDLGEKWQCQPPPNSPTGSLRILYAQQAAVPAPRTAAACLSPWQPGQKTNLLGSKLESYLGARS